MLKRAPLITLIAIVLFSSCRTYRPVSNSAGRQGQTIPVTSSGSVTLDYINTYRDIAVNEMKRTGVPASITLAQGMIESNYGRSRLAIQANNHFGIKCHNNWSGQVVFHDDDRKDDCFRKYRNPEESFRDHSDFLRTGSRYRFLFDLPADDYKGWARGLKQAGYATNPDYANMLIRKIEEENLTVYDKGYTDRRVAGKVEVINRKDQINSNITASITDNTIIAKVSRVRENNRIEYIIVRDGDTRERIEEEFKLLRWELTRYNELENDFSLTPGQILYLQPKRARAEAGKNNYTIAEGDTMYLIAQRFGIKLKSLYEMNRMEAGTEPDPGTKLWLRSMKPVD